jgi:hypothetical protein
MKKIFFKTLINITIIIIFFLFFYFFKDDSNINLYKLVDLEHILLILFLSVSKAIYDYVRERKL